MTDLVRLTLHLPRDDKSDKVQQIIAWYDSLSRGKAGRVTRHKMRSDLINAVSQFVTKGSVVHAEQVIPEAASKPEEKLIAEVTPIAPVVYTEPPIKVSAMAPPKMDMMALIAASMSESDDGMM